MSHDKQVFIEDCLGNSYVFSIESGVGIGASLAADFGADALGSTAEQLIYANLMQ